MVPQCLNQYFVKSYYAPPTHILHPNHCSYTNRTGQPQYCPGAPYYRAWQRHRIISESCAQLRETRTALPPNYIDSIPEPHRVRFSDYTPTPAQHHQQDVFLIPSHQLPTPVPQSRRPPPSYASPYPTNIYPHPPPNTNVRPIYTDGSTNPNPGFSAYAWLAPPRIYN